MWKSDVGQKATPVVKSESSSGKPAVDDDWETGEVSIMTEKEQRWGKGREVEQPLPLNQLAQKTAQVGFKCLN